MSRSSPNQGFWRDAAYKALVLGALHVACAGGDDEHDSDTDNLQPETSTGGSSLAPPRAPTGTGASGGSTAQAMAAGGAGGVRRNAGGAGGAPATGGSGGMARGGAMETAGRGGSATSGGDGGSSMNSGDGGSGGEPNAAGSVSFAEDIHPILVARCGGCHASSIFLPRFASSDVQAAYDVAADLSDTIVDVLDAGEMPPACGGPPGGNGCVSQAEFELILAWTVDGTPE